MRAKVLALLWRVRYSPLSIGKWRLASSVADDDIHSLFVEAHRLGLGTSPVTQWLLAHAQEFAGELAGVRRPNWPKLAQVLYERKSVGGKNGPVSGRALRDAWYRVRLYLRERGEAWVEIRDPPRGMPRKRRKAMRSPVGTVEPAQAVAAPAPERARDALARAGTAGIRELLARHDRQEKPWLTGVRKPNDD